MSQLMMLLTLITLLNCFICILPPTSPTTDKFCVSHSTIPSKVHGIYEYIYWKQSVNASIYYNKNIDAYLFPWILSPTDKRYNIGPYPTQNVADSYCSISNPSPSYVFNPLDCTDNWNNDPNMRLVKCTDICITGSNKQWLHGTYVWSHFNLTTSASVYYCTECNAHSGVYLYDLNNEWQTLTGLIWDIHDGTDGVNITECIIACKDGINTPFYGLIRSAPASTHINIGVINEIMSWYIYTDDFYPVLEKSIYKFQFRSAGGYTSDLLGSGGESSNESCNAFQLDTTDYINGYRVIYGECVYALFFYTANNKVYSCASSSLNYGSYTDSGIITFDGYYLSGLYAHTGWIMDALSFQFSSIENCTYNPTTNPTVNPTKYPTNYPTNYSTNYPWPTKQPTRNPTLQPVKSASVFPTEHPTQVPTNSPSNNPISYQLSTLNPTTLNSTLLPTDINDDDGRNNKNSDDKSKALVIFSIVGVFIILIITVIVIILLGVIIKYKTSEGTTQATITPQNPVKIEMNTDAQISHQMDIISLSDSCVAVNDIENNKNQNQLQPGAMGRSQSVPSKSEFSTMIINKKYINEDSTDDELYNDGNETIQTIQEGTGGTKSGR